MPTLLQVAQMGNQVLREKCKEVENITDASVQNLIDDMIATCVDYPGVGIAAPQVYQPLRLFIVASNPSPRYPNAPKMEPTAIINPTIISTSVEIEKDWEGCMSIPGIRGLVTRHKSIRVSFTHRNGLVIEETYTDFLARVFQHEYDHIEGVLFLDRADSRELATDKEYQRLVKLEEKKH
jgi:peptide deformylase